MYCLLGREENWRAQQQHQTTCLERFSFECRKTKTKVITLANHKDTDNTVNQSKLVDENGSMALSQKLKESGRQVLSPLRHHCSLSLIPKGY